MECMMPTPFSEEQKAQVKSILESAKTIAVIGLSPDESKDSNRVAKYLIACGYNVIPVYPKEDTILGCKVFRSLAEIDVKVDIVNIFRNGDALGAIVEEAAKLSPALVWGQIGCHNETAEQRASELGLNIVTNKCIMVEHKKLFGN
ncbi:MAG: CoA-binding protein [Campylobacterales bacterium]|nr:CoA-binding protein [Campylobacterales bacterium]